VSKRAISGFVSRRLLVLTALAGGPSHGYALINEIEHLSGTRIGPGTLYGLLADLEQSGLIEEVPSESRRCPFRLTASGRAFLIEKLNEADRLVAIGRQRLAIP